MTPAPDTITQGDALEGLRTLPDASVDMIFTDPPFGHNNNNGDLIANREKALGRGEPGDPRPIANDGRENADRLYRGMLTEAARILKPAGSCCCCCCCGGGGPDPQFARWSLWMDEALTFKQMIVWDKGPMGMGWHYRRSYETVLVGHRGPSCRWYANGKDVENIIRPSHGIRKIIPSADEHPTAKPVELASFFIQLHTQPGDIVLDPFCGGGSTLVAAKNLGRRWIGIEIDGRWIEMAEKRLAQEVMPL